MASAVNCAVLLEVNVHERLPDGARRAAQRKGPAECPVLGDGILAHERETCAHEEQILPYREHECEDAEDEDADRLRAGHAHVTCRVARAAERHVGPAPLLRLARDEGVRDGVQDEQRGSQPKCEAEDRRVRAEAGSVPDAREAAAGQWHGEAEHAGEGADALEEAGPPVTGRLSGIRL